MLSDVICRLQEEILQREDSENNLQAFRQVCAHLHPNHGLHYDFKYAVSLVMCRILEGAKNQR